MTTQTARSTDRRWMDRAVCRTDQWRYFFDGCFNHNPRKRRHPTFGESRAIAICAGCPVRSECLEYALGFGTGLLGVFGGTTQTERAGMIRERGRRTG